MKIPWKKREDGDIDKDADAIFLESIENDEQAKASTYAYVLESLLRFPRFANFLNKNYVIYAEIVTSGRYKRSLSLGVEEVGDEEEVKDVHGKLREKARRAQAKKEQEDTPAGREDVKGKGESR